MARGLHGVTAPTGAAVLDSFLPALAAALDGAGPALLPLPTGGTREAVLTAMRTDLPLERDDVALVVATSGSTGEPKGTMLTADALRAAAEAAHQRLGGPGQWLVAMPVAYVGGLQMLVRSLVARIRPVVLDIYGGFDTDAFAATAATMDPRRRTYVSLVPTQLRRLLDAGSDLSGFHAVLVGAAALPDELRRRCEDRGWRLVSTYGMSETSGGVVYDGRPLGGVDVEVADGRITIGGPTIFAGYRLQPELTATALVDGRHVTADLGRFDNDGLLHVLGRADDVIISGGVNVAAAAVERVLGEHPNVSVCAVVGVPDREWGQRVVAVVQPTRWDLAPTLDQLRAFAATRLEPAELPREVLTVGLLPMLDSGKPDKAAVRTLVGARAS